MHGAKIVVLGDVIEDRHIEVKRIGRSPEGECSDFVVVKRDMQTGGAGNVFRQIVAFCPDVILEDHELEVTEKTRIWCGEKQVCRYEDRHSYIEQHKPREGQWRDAEIVVLIDYGKGALSPSKVQQIVAECPGKVILDPKYPYFKDVKGLYAVTPNQREVKRTGLSPTLLSAQMGKTWVVETRGAAGIRLWRLGALITEFPGRHLTPVVDTIGAGECVTAFIAIMLARGASMRDACERANLEAAKTVRHRGCFVIQKEDTHEPGCDTPELGPPPPIPSPRVQV